MKYNVHLSDLKEFYNDTYMNRSNISIGFNSKDSIESEFFDMHIDEWKTNQFKSHLLKIKPKKDLNILGGMNDFSTVLHFTCKGDASVGFGKNKISFMKENTHNIFEKLTDNVIHTFRENTQYEFFKVYIPNDYISRIGETYLVDFQSSHKNEILGKPELGCQSNSLTTIEMNMVIDQIKNCHLMGNIAPKYYEAKVQELICLNINSRLQKTNNYQEKYKHYLDQVIQARNTLEKQFQNPPTIRQLAMIVGMSTTVLKECFKNIIGNTIHGHLFEFRMEIAKKLLINSNYTISEIAEKSGYEHACHFTIAFKRKFGIVPSEFKKNRI